MTGTGAICTPLHLRKPPPSWGLSLPVTHLQPATVGRVTPQAMEYVVQKRQSEEVGALRSSKKEVRRGHTCHGWVPTAECQRRALQSRDGSHLIDGSGFHPEEVPPFSSERVFPYLDRR